MRPWPWERACEIAEDIVDGVFRVLNRKGKVSARWQAKNADLPQDPAAVRVRLEQEGLAFDAQGRADPARRWSPPADDDEAFDGTHARIG